MESPPPLPRKDPSQSCSKRRAEPSDRQTNREHTLWSTDSKVAASTGQVAINAATTLAVGRSKTDSVLIPTQPMHQVLTAVRIAFSRRREVPPAAADLTDRPSLPADWPVSPVLFFPSLLPPPITDIMTQPTTTPNTGAGRLRPTTGAPIVPGKLLGNWQLQQVIGQGALTLVYSARPLGCPPSWPADYVVKLLRHELRQDPPALQAMRREAEVGRHRSHPNLVPILESHVDHDWPHIVMPRLDGAALNLVLERVGRLALPQALWLTRQIAQALRHLHAQGWIHGDVKPANIIVSRQGHATLIDLAFAMRPDESFYSPHRPLVGTLAYVAPELFTSTSLTHPASDIYSLGVTLFELIAGRRPFMQADTARLVEAHLRDNPPDLATLLPGVPQSVCDLARRMLSKSSLRRPQSCEELIDELTELEIESLDARFPETGAA